MGRIAAVNSKKLPTQKSHRCGAARTVELAFRACGALLEGGDCEEYLLATKRSRFVRRFFLRTIEPPGP